MKRISLYMPPRLQAAVWLYVFLWTGLLMVPEPRKLLGLDSDETATAIIPLDKLSHALGYGVFLVLTAAVYDPFNRLTRLCGIFTVGMIHGGVTEIAQCWIPARQGDLVDWSADVVGLVVAFGMLLTGRRLRENSRKRKTSKR